MVPLPRPCVLLLPGMGRFSREKGGTASPNVNRGLLCSNAVSRRGMGPSSSAHSSGSRGWRAAEPGCFGNISLRRQLSLGKQSENTQKDRCC